MIFLEAKPLIEQAMEGHAFATIKLVGLVAVGFIVMIIVVRIVRSRTFKVILISIVLCALALLGVAYYTEWELMKEVTIRVGNAISSIFH